MSERAMTGLWFSPDYAAPKQDLPLSPSDLRPAGTSPSETSPVGKRKILVWNSSRNEADAMQDQLSLQGFQQIKIATSYDEGFAYLQAHRFDLFIIDQNTGEHGGLKLVQALRDSITYKHTPVLVTTASNELDVALEAMKIGANDLLNKPINFSLLTQKVALHINVKHQNG